MDTTEKRCHDAVNHSTEIVKKRRVRRKLFKDGLADEHKEKEPVFHKFGGLRTECVCFFVFCKYRGLLYCQYGSGYIKLLDKQGSSYIKLHLILTTAVIHV